MKRKIFAALLVIASGTAGAAIAESTMPAWQDPAFVMEEIIVTAPRVAEQTTLEWQEAGYIMEEVVVTAARPAVESRRARRFELPHRRIARSISPAVRAAWFSRALIHRAGQLDLQIDSLAVTP
jgi:hypothetical protein